LKRRILAVALAVVLAALGTAGVLAYVHKADARAVAGMKAVTVLVARQQITSGTSASTALQDGSLASQRLPASSVPSDALHSIAPGLGSLVLSATLQPGQLLLRPMLVTAAQSAATGGVAIPKGMVAVTVSLCLPEAVAGYIQPGSEVAVFDTYANGSLTAQPNCNGPHQQQDFGSAHTRLVLPRVEVLSVGQGPASAQGQSATNSTAYSGSQASSGTPAQGEVLVTLAVNQANAERLILLTEAGLPYLALLTSSSQTSFDTTLVPLFQP
jgi:pilus assembly protein CpaB